jgi:hypothetical protein
MGKTFAPGDVPFADDLNNFLQAWAITVPTSVSGGTASSSGIVTFTSQTSIVLEDIFADNYNMYRVIIECSGAASQIGFQLRTGGSNSATNYDQTRLVARNSTVVSTTPLNLTSGVVSGPMANTLLHIVVDIAKPNLAVPTTMLAFCGVHSNPAVVNNDNGTATTFVTHRPATAYESLRVILTGSQSGTIRVYGYK